MKINIAKRTPNLFECALIVLACMNFAESGSIVYLVFGLFVFLRMGKYKTNYDLLFCFVLSVSVFVSAAAYYSLNEAIKGFIYFLVYVFGNSGYAKAKDKEQFLTRTILSIFLGFLVFVLLTYVYNLDKTLEYEGQRIIYSVWTQGRVAATLVGLLSCVLIGFSCWALLFSKKRKFQLLAIVGIVFVVLLNVRTATRTPFVMALLVYGVMLCVALFSSAIKRKWAMLSSVVMILVVAGILYSIDVWGVREYIESSPLFARFASESLETSRWEILIVHLKMAPSYLWGGGNIERITGKGAHFYLQQFYDRFGLIAAIPLLLLSVSFLRNIWRLVCLRKKNRLDMLLLCMYLSMLVQCCLEPVFTGYPVLFWSLLLIHGMANAYLKDRKQANTYA